MFPQAVLFFIAGVFCPEVNIFVAVGVPIVLHSVQFGPQYLAISSTRLSPFVALRNIKMITAYMFLGAVFFFVGITLMRSTKDVKSKDEGVS